MKEYFFLTNLHLEAEIINDRYDYRSILRIDGSIISGYRSISDHYQSIITIYTLELLR
ncbi:MAG: hypothetical protein ABWX58_02365 [Psychrobacillus psychrotolerans]